MIEVKNDFSRGLNQDDNYFRLPENCYVDALNCTRDAISANADNVISNIVGNRVISYNYPSGTNICIGSIANPLRNTAIAFVWNSNGFHSIVEFNLTSRTSDKILENLTDTGDEDILGFTQAGKITGINIINRDEGDLLFFLDSIGRPTFLNITFFKDGTYTPVTRQIIDLAAIWPYTPPSAIYGNDAARVSNYLRKKLFRFKYRWVLDDDMKTTWSPISAIPLPANILNPVFTNVITNNNRITVALQSGPKNVKAVEIAVGIQNNNDQFSRFQLVESINKADESISDDTSFSIEFYNDSTFPFIADSESDLLFSYVPRTAIAQETPNGNVLAFAAITEGYDRDLEANVTLTINTVAAGGGAAIGSLNGVLSDNVLPSVSFKLTFSGVPATGTSITVRANNGGSAIVATYTTVAGDTALSVTTGLLASATTISILSASLVAPPESIRFSTVLTGYVFESLTITPPANAANTNSIATWPFWGQRRIGIVYFDEKGRTNGIIYDAAITFPSYNENVSDQVLLPYVNIKIFHVPPIWAYSYSICFTKDVTPILYVETVDVNITESEYIYFDITNLPLNQRKNPTTAAVVSWSFQDGDRMKLIRRMSDGFVFGGSAFDTGIEGMVFEPTINNVLQEGKTFVKIRNVAPFSTETYTSDFFIIQLYRPTLQEPNNENATFYECGITLQIIDPGTDERRHTGLVTDQSANYVTPAETNIYEGDVYFRVRNQVLGETGVGTFFVQDRNFVDTNISAVSNIDGRALVIDVNAKETFFPALIRYSLAFQQNTNINQLNIFMPANFDEYDYRYGSVMALKCRDRFMRVFQELKVGVVYLFSKLGKAPNGDEITIQTDQLLNPINYYSGDYGIGNQKESLASFNYADYFTSNITGGIYRISLNGLENLSVLYKMNSWAIENLPLRTGNAKVYGAYDQRLNNYIIAAEEAPLSGEMVINFQGKIDIGVFVDRYLCFITGSPSPANSINVYLINGDGIERNYSYTLQEGDSILDACTNLRNSINADIYFTAIVSQVFPTAGLVVDQVTSNNPNLFNGLTTITYTPDSASQAQTLTFSEEDNTFESFLSMKPENMCTVGTMLCSFKNGQCWTHDSDEYNTFFGTSYESTVTVVFNANGGMKKSPISITEYGSSVWDCPEIIGQAKTYGNVNQETNLVAAELVNQENSFSASIKRDTNSYGGKWNGQYMKGSWLSVKFRNQNATDLTTLELVILKYNESPLNVR